MGTTAMTKPLRVIGIDPGYDRLGLAIVERDNNVETVIFSTCLTSPKTAVFDERLLSIGTQLREIVSTYQPSRMAIETLFFNRNQKTAIAVAAARGVCVFVGRECGCVIDDVSPQAVKIAITGYGKSDKEAVTRMVQRLVRGVRADALDDEYDAIAIGVTALANYRPHRHD
jgi:crossover junction endodeoxyribonuclease RuvC